MKLASMVYALTMPSCFLATTLPQPSLPFPTCGRKRTRRRRNKKNEQKRCHNRRMLLFLSSLEHLRYSNKKKQNKQQISAATVPAPSRDGSHAEGEVRRPLQPTSLAGSSSNLMSSDGPGEQNRLCERHEGLRQEGLEWNAPDRYPPIFFYLFTRC